MALPSGIGIDDGLPATILVERESAVGAVGDTLCLEGSVIGIGKNQRGMALAAQAAGVLAVEDGRAGEHHPQAVGEEGVVQLLPVQEVRARSVAPVHVLPVTLVGVVLIEEVVLAVVIDEPVGVVHPSTTCGEVELRTLGLAVHRGLSHNGIGHEEATERCITALIGERERLAAIGREVLEHPIIGFALGQAHEHRQVVRPRGVEGETPSLRTVRDGDVQIASPDLQRTLGCLHGACGKQQEEEERGEAFHRVRGEMLICTGKSRKAGCACRPASQ